MEILSGGEIIAGGELEDFMCDIIFAASGGSSSINDREALSLGGFVTRTDACELNIYLHCNLTWGYVDRWILL